MRSSSGFSFVEVIITVAIIAVMSTGASIYFSDIIDKTNKDKALSDLKQIRKVLKHYESELPAGLTSYTQVSESVEIRDLRKLVQKRKMSEMPTDPWGNEYRIDIEAGIIYSQGNNMHEGYDYSRFTLDMPVERAISNSVDDIIVRFKPKFAAERACLFEELHRNELISVIALDFTRPVDYTTLTTDSAFELLPTTTTIVSTAVVDIVKRRQVKIRLSDPLNKSTSWAIRVKANEVASVDTTSLETDVVLDLERPHDL